MSGPLLEVQGLSVRFAASGPGGSPATLRALDEVGFSIERGDILGVVGESGCGKSTLARAILRLVPVAAGAIRFDGTDYAAADDLGLRPLRRAVRMVFQDPLASVNPRFSVLQAVREPLDIFEPRLARRERDRRAVAMLDRVGLGAAFAGRYPHELSGGQNQRVSIARALVAEPRLVICDEAVSALDVSVQAQILNLLADLRRDTGIALLFISHDLPVVRHLSRRLLVLYLGRTMEYGDAATLFSKPRHPYTRSLIDAVPVPDPLVERTRSPLALRGDAPSPFEPPSGCVFRTRCPRASTLCESSTPPLRGGPERAFACHHPLEDPTP